MKIPEITIFTGGGLSPERIIINLITYALFFIGAVALGFVIYGGVQFVVSGGDSDKTTKARNTLLYAVVGVIVVILSYTIVQWASTSFLPVLQK